MSLPRVVITGFIKALDNFMDADLSTDDAANAERLVVLKWIRKRVDKAISKHEAPYRGRTTNTGHRFVSGAATGRLLEVGHVEFRRFDDKEQTIRQAGDPTVVRDLLAEAGIAPEAVLETLVVVHVDRLEGLVALGKITTDQLDEVTELVTKTTKGRFTVKAVKELDELLKGLS